MLSRIYIDNYKCLVNFSMEPGGLSILHGDNGCGKSIVFDALRAIRSLIRDELTVGEAFPPESLTRFEQRDQQRFELELISGGVKHNYLLVVQQPAGDYKVRQGVVIAQEELRCENELLFSFNHGIAQLYRTDGQPPAALMLNPRKSALTMVQPQPFVPVFQRFRDLIAGLIITQPIPSAMSGNMDVENDYLADDASNFASWWQRFILVHNTMFVPGLFKSLGEVIEGFRGFTRQSNLPSSKQFSAIIECENGPSQSIKYSFNEFSDGERVLIVLYTLLHGLEPGSHILLLDEPDNFVSLPELQPWLMSLYEQCEDNGLQALVISHHPEFYDFLGGQHSIWLKREANGPARVVERPQYPAAEERQGLKLSELVARRWLE